MQGSTPVGTRGRVWVPDTKLAVNRSGVWEIRWSEWDSVAGRARSRSYSCRTSQREEALEVRQAWLVASGRAQVAAGGVQVAELVAAYKRDRGVVVGSTQDWALRQIVAGLGGLDVSDLGGGTAAVVGYRASRAAVGVAAPTVRRELGALKAVLNWARAAGLVPEGFRPLVALPPEGSPKTRYLSEAEEARMWGLASEWFLNSGRPFRERRTALFVCFALETAAREAAVRGLTWDRVIWASGGTGGVLDFRDPLKVVSRKRRVPVPVSDRLAPVLAAAYGEVGRAGEYVLGHPGAVRKGFEAFREKHGFGDITIHDLRRTWASLRVQWGVPLEQVAAVLGDTMEVVQKHYAHFSPSFLRGAINARSGGQP